MDNLICLTPQTTIHNDLTFLQNKLYFTRLRAQESVFTVSVEEVISLIYRLDNIVLRIKELRALCQRGETQHNISSLIQEVDSVTAEIKAKTILKGRQCI